MNRAQRRRHRVLSRQMKVSDDRFDTLSLQRDQLNALVELLGSEIAANEIAAQYAELDRLENLDEEVYQPIDDELRALDALRTHHLLNVVLAVAIVIAISLRWLAWPIRRVMSRRCRRAKKPAPPGNDESISDSLARWSGLVMCSDIISSSHDFQ